MYRSVSSYLAEIIGRFSDLDKIPKNGRLREGNIICHYNVMNPRSTGSLKLEESDVGWTSVDRETDCFGVTRTSINFFWLIYLSLDSDQLNTIMYS